MASLVNRLIKAVVEVVGQSLFESASQKKSGTKPAQKAPGKKTSAARGIHEVPVTEALQSASYSPQKDGQADPGEVVWTWVPYEEDASQGKDRPVVVIGRQGEGVYVVQLTSKDHDSDAAQEARWGRYWMDIGSGPWDPQGRPSEVRLDRALWVPIRDVRREGAALPKATWEKVVAAVEEHAKH